MSAPFSFRPTTARSPREVAARLDAAGFSTSTTRPGDPTLASRGMPDWLNAAIAAAYDETEACLLVTKERQDAVVLIYSRKEWATKDTHLSLFDDFPRAERFVRVLAVRPTFGRAIEGVLVDA